MFDFDEQELQRYSRNILLKDVGIQGQERLRRGKVLIVGLGGLGAPVAYYLAAAGIGCLGLIDGDKVELSNLGRQVIHFTSDIQRWKTDSASEKIRSLNPYVETICYDEPLTDKNVERIISSYDFIVDATDNFQTKFLINDACVMYGKPFSYGALLQFHGQTFTHLPGQACVRCIYGSPPPYGTVPSCSQAGVLGAVPGIIGTIQVAEALKYIIGLGSLLTDSLLTIDALSMDFQKISIQREKNCPVCGHNPIITSLKYSQSTSENACSR